MVLHVQRPVNGREVQAEGQVDLPSDLLARGFKLITRAPDRMFAVSESWGCTATKTTLANVITEAWELIDFCEAMNRKKAQYDHDDEPPD